jgi:hypothetical protein
MRGKLSHEHSLRKARTLSRVSGGPMNNPVAFRRAPVYHRCPMESAKQPASRVLWVVVLVVCSLWIGFVVGTAAGARFFVPPGSGLAAGPAAMGYGVVAACVLAVLAGFMARQRSIRSLRSSARIASVLALLLFGWIVYRVIVVLNRTGS